LELNEFVAQTLSQIASGVKEAQSSAKSVGAVINPHFNTTWSEAGQHGFLNSSHGFASIVEFDVALTVTAGTGTKGGIGVFAGAVTLGSSGQSQNEHSTVSRVKFSVPVVLPAYEG
jgi:hypothetical protein